MKTNRSAAKRFRQTKKGKIMRRYTSQDHFNAREPGKQKRRKRRKQEVATPDQKNLKKLLS
ncbi:50S ribosomal protein L35 [Patescibacteria group bacterium]